MPRGSGYREHLWRPGGYRSYADYRAHGYGKRPAAERVTSEERRRYGGHAGKTELIQAINRVHRSADGSRGPFIIEIQPNGIERGAGGRWKTIRMDAYTATGEVWHYYLRGRAASHRSLLQIKEAMAHPGAAKRGTPPAGFPSGARGEGASYDGGDDEDGGEEEFDEEGEWDEWYFDYEDEYDWDVPYGIATSIGEFSS